MLKLTVTRERWPMKEAIGISDYAFTHFNLTVVDSGVPDGMIRCSDQWGFPLRLRP